MKIRKLIHKDDPYSRWLPIEPEDLQGWGAHKEYFEERIKETAPSLILEIGTWKGKSAVCMAEICREYQLQTEIICIDTWLGSQEMWVNHDDEKRYKSLQLKNGYPSLYYQFLNNVVIRGVQDYITPFPQTSINAARFLKNAGVQADLIYVDASHEYEDVVTDLKHYYDLLAPGGVMFGDDYCDYWSGVIQAVDEFTVDNLLSLELERFENPDGQAPSDYWKVVKPL